MYLYRVHSQLRTNIPRIHIATSELLIWAAHSTTWQLQRCKWQWAIGNSIIVVSFCPGPFSSFCLFSFLFLGWESHTRYLAKCWSCSWCLWWLIVGVVKVGGVALGVWQRGGGLCVCSPSVFPLSSRCRRGNEAYMSQSRLMGWALEQPRLSAWIHPPFIPHPYLQLSAPPRRPHQKYNPH